VRAGPFVRKLCQDLDLIHCVTLFGARASTGKIQYFRLHGMTGYQYRYTDEDLKKCEDGWKRSRPT